MKKQLLKLAARAALPAVVPTTRDLRSAAMVKAAHWAAHRAAPGLVPTPARARGTSVVGGRKTRAASFGLAAAAAALPLGLWVGNRMRDR